MRFESRKFLSWLLEWYKEDDMMCGSSTKILAEHDKVLQHLIVQAYGAGVPWHCKATLDPTMP